MKNNQLNDKIVINILIFKIYESTNIIIYVFVHQHANIKKYSYSSLMNIYL